MARLNKVKGFWKDRPVLVTGATGLLGPWLIRQLLDQGASVTALIRDWLPGSELHRGGLDGRISAVRGFVEDQTLLERTLNEYEIETVFHLAAQTIVGTANRNPISTFETNIKGTCTVLEACRRVSSIKRIVVASSDKAYGEQRILPYKEDARLAGTHPYDVSKSCADLISRSYFETYGLPVCVTRCGNFYGGGDLNFSRIVPGTIRSALAGQRPRIRSDGKSIRDYFYVEDGARANIHLAERMDDRRVMGEAFNFSNELQIPVMKIVQSVLGLMGRKDLAPIVADEAKGEIRHQFLSAAKARRLLGWKPAFSLEEGLTRTIAWYKEFFNVS